MDRALGRIAVVLELESVVVLGISVFGIVRCVVFERGQPQSRPFQVDKCLQSCRGVVCLSRDVSIVYIERRAIEGR